MTQDENVEIARLQVQMEHVEKSLEKMADGVTRLAEMGEIISGLQRQIDLQAKRLDTQAEEIKALKQDAFAGLLRWLGGIFAGLILLWLTRK